MLHSRSTQWRRARRRLKQNRCSRSPNSRDGFNRYARSQSCSRRSGPQDQHQPLRIPCGMYPNAKRHSGTRVLNISESLRRGVQHIAFEAVHDFEIECDTRVLAVLTWVGRYSCRWQSSLIGCIRGTTPAAYCIICCDLTPHGCHGSPRPSTHSGFRIFGCIGECGDYIPQGIAEF